MRSERMNLLVRPVPEFEETVKELYTDHGSFHEGDSGLDLFCLTDYTVPARSYSVKIPLGVSMEAFYLGPFNGKTTRETNFETKKIPTGFYLYPRSSTGSKTPIRLSNSVGIIDAGYRGPLMAIVDNISDDDFTLKRGERYFQVCAPDLGPIQFKLVDTLSETTRGEEGFGSTGR